MSALDRSLRSSCIWLALVTAGCSGAAVKTGPEPVSYGEWCQIVCDATAERTNSSCGLAIIDASVCQQTCARDRGEEVSQRTYDEANACVSYIETLDCVEVGEAIGASAVGQGEFVERCSAR